MDFMSSGPTRSTSRCGILRQVDGTERVCSHGIRRLMSSFGEHSSHGSESQPDGPVLVLPPARKTRRRGLWARRVWLVVFVLFCLETGIILTWCPWTKVWTENSLFMSFPGAHVFLLHNFVRGTVTGLGLVNLWIGVSEA